MTMKPFRFRHEWALAHPADDAYAALADVESYPSWWPQVRGGYRIDDGAGLIRCRSLLPFDVTITASRLIEDPVGRILRARLGGHLVGWSQWTVTPTDTGCRVVYEQEVVARMRAARFSGPLGRPLMRLNHAHMIRAGRRGLGRHLANTSTAPVPN